jgi:hypothetical protein
MTTEQHEAEEQLRLVQRAHKAAERNSIENGMIFLVWGVLIAIGLALFDLFSGPVATGIWAAIAVSGTVVTARYASRFGVVPRRPRSGWIFLAVLCIYYPVILIGGIRLFPAHPHFLFTIIGLLTALPLFVAGIVQQWRTRGA